jgi:hypothetical protein
MFLRRSTASSQTLVRNQLTGEEILNSDDLTFDYQGTPRFGLMRIYPSCHGWDVNYFGLQSWTTTARSGSEDVSPAYEGPGGLIPSTRPGTIFRTDYGTDLYSVEVNYRYRVRDCVTLVAGFRWLELGDEFSATRIAPTDQDLFTVDTNNHLYGFQIGLDTTLWERRGRFQVDATLRAAILGNHADQQTVAPFYAGSPVFVDSITASADHTSFFGELGLQGLFWLTPRIAVRGGYQLMWLEGVALAPEQIPVTDLIAPGEARVDTGGNLFLDGATVGMLVRF